MRLARIARLVVASMWAACFTTACDPSSPPPRAPGPADRPATPSATASAPPVAPVAPSSRLPPEIAQLPAPSAAEARAVAAASNAFAFDLHRRLAAKSGNLFYSPMSIASALSMAWGGAAGATREEMRAVLRFDGPPESVLGPAARLAADLQRPEEPSIAIANRLFGEATHRFEPAYLADAAKLFGAPLERVDFKRAPEPSRRRINDWVEERTRGRIRDILPEGAIHPKTRLALVNAIHFLGTWKHAFSSRETAPKTFWVDGTTATQVPMMRRAQLSLPYTRLDGTYVLDVPYTGDRISMLIVMPASKELLPEVEATLDLARYDRWIAGLQPYPVTLELPRFEVDPSEPTKLRDDLIALGMKTAFREDADFSRLAKPAAGESGIFLDDVFHKAFVKVDEAGTEAAAATVVTGRVLVSMGSGPLLFDVDAPFLFFIRDRQSGMILFAGRITDPRSKG